MPFHEHSLRQILNTFMYTTVHISQNCVSSGNLWIWYHAQCFGEHLTLSSRREKSNPQTRIINLFFQPRGKKKRRSQFLDFSAKHKRNIHIIEDNFTFPSVFWAHFLFYFCFLFLKKKTTSPNGLEDILNIRRGRKKMKKADRVRLFAIQQMARAQQSRDYYGMPTNWGRWGWQRVKIS